MIGRPRKYRRTTTLSFKTDEAEAKALRSFRAWREWTEGVSLSLGDVLLQAVKESKRFREFLSAGDERRALSVKPRQKRSGGGPASPAAPATSRRATSASAVSARRRTERG